MPTPDPLASPSNAELLARARRAYASALDAYSLAKGDRKIERQMIDKLSQEIETIQSWINLDESPGDGGIILGIFNGNYVGANCGNRSKL